MCRGCHAHRRSWPASAGVSSSRRHLRRDAAHPCLISSECPFFSEERNCPGPQSSPRYTYIVLYIYVGAEPDDAAGRPRSSAHAGLSHHQRHSSPARGALARQSARVAWYSAMEDSLTAGTDTEPDVVVGAESTEGAHAAFAVSRHRRWPNSASEGRGFHRTAPRLLG